WHTQLPAGDPEATAAAMDVEDPDSVRAALAHCQSHLGPIDILVLNGPGPKPGQPSEVTGEDAQAAVARLVSPHLQMLSATLPGMRERGWGRVIAIGSTAVITPSQQLVLSTMGRQALAGYLKALAGEVAPQGVTVNMVHPGRIATPRIDQLDADQAQREGVSSQQVRAQYENTIPVRRLGDPAEMGAAVAFLASERAGYITGTSLRLDGGVTPVS
ncbi:MAG: SDR family oxidoreductase, partial [Actinomycetaceae bacterium]|nr:SDR family oxidoreductase [Actinomycetaceae bacterium]